MLKIVNKFIILLILVSFNGCKSQNSDFNSSQITKSNNNNTLKDNDDKILSKIGISTDKDKIIIEPKKTKAFFDKLTKTLEKEAKKFESKVDKIDKKDIGIEASKDKITIDVNKTSNFLKNFAKELENVAKDIDKVVNEK